MNHLDNLFNNPVRRIDEIMAEIFNEIDAEGGMENVIRREKACKINDIFRGAKLAQCYDYRFVVELKDPVELFDKLYDLDLDALDAYSKALDKKNTEYCQKQVLSHNRGESGGWL